MTPGAVSLPPESWVEGDVHARSVAVRGTVEGNLVAEDTVELGPEASLDGDIMCRTLVVAAGAVVTRPVPDLTIAGGVPARVLRRRVEQPGLALVRRSLAGGA